MNIKVILSTLALSVAAAPSFAQTAEQDCESAEQNSDDCVAAVVAPVTGFAPVAGAALGAAGPLALGLGAIIAVGAIAGGGSSGTSGTN